jgi:hypothetical protein
MNILEAEDMVKGLPDQVLFQYAQNPPPQIPQFLAVSEVQRRQEMRQRFQAQGGNAEPTIKDQILQGGIASAGGPPPGGEPPPMAPPGAAPPGAPMQQPMTGAPMGMYQGGQVPYRMQEGRSVPDFLNSLTPNFLLEASRANRERMAGVIPNRANEQDVVTQAKALAQSGRVEEAAALLRDAGISPAQVIRPPAAVATTPPMEAAVMTRGPLTRGAVSPQVSPAPVASMTPPPMETAVNPPAAAPVAAPVAPPMAPPAAEDPYAQRFDNLLSRLPQVYESIQGIMPKGGGINMAELQKFAPTQADYISPELAAKRDQLQSQLQEMGRSRRAEDIALAQRYLSEAEAPIKQAQDEARKSAIASTLMRLGAGVMSGRPEQGLASAAESVESIMSRAREQASAERRAARQDFRTAERAATQAERSTADAAFQLQAQNITADENKQREFVRDQKQFAQWAFGQMRQAGQEARQAQESAVRLSIGIAQSIDQAIDQATREANISDRQYAQSFSTIYKEVLDTIKEGGVDAEGNEISYTPEQAIEVAKSKTSELLRSQGIGPSSGENIVVYQGKPIRFPNKEAADKFRNQVGL